MARVYQTAAALVGLASLVMASRSSRADTVISGGNLGGQVWTAENGPYRVGNSSGDPTVPAGQELRIEAGTVVLFAADPGSNGEELVVDGRLTVAGTAAAPAVLQADPVNADPRWGGIIVQGDQPVQITGAIIRGASKGISI